MTTPTDTTMGPGAETGVRPAVTEPRALGRGLASLRLLVRDKRALIAVPVLTLTVIVALFAPLIEPHDPAQLGVGAPLQAPSLEFPMGTDAFGRDQLSRVIAGARISVAVALVVAGAAVAIGFPLGLLVGYAGGRLDFVVGRTLDILFAFPSLLLALVLSTILRPGLRTVIIALIIVYVPIVARFVRGAVAAERRRDYVLGAHIAGASPFRIVVRHIVPNTISPLIVLTTAIMAFTVLAEAALSYLGFGTQPPTSSWGKMLTENQTYASTEAYLVVFPGLAITVLVLALNLLGDSLRDHLDPRQRETV
jgi:ABC-type dipeptide/oligopeptide/nickel transport system permease subunit